MGWFRRSHTETPRPYQVSVYEPEQAKSAQFTPDVIQAVLEYGGWWGNSYGAMYRKQPAVRSIVDFLARNVAQLNAKVYERVSNTDRLEVPDHPLAVLLQNPNPSVTRYRHMRQTVSDLAIYDRAYWLKIRAGRSLAVTRISPANLCIETDEYGNRTYRTNNGKVISRDQLVIFPGYSPDTSEEGISPLETLRRVLREEANISQAREAGWRNSARASGWIQRPLDAPEWSDSGRQRFRADIEAMLAGANNTGRIGVLEEGMTWNTGSYQPPDTEYINSRRLTYEEVAIVYFGPIGGRAWLDAATQTGSEENHRQMYQDVLGPILEQLQEEIELQLLPEVQPLRSGGTYVEFNLAAKLKGSFEEQAKVATTATGVPSVSVNETRARMNLPRIDDDRFDMPVMPMNVIYGGQPAVTVPTADPSTPPTPGTAALPVGRTKAVPRSVLARRDRIAREHEEILRKFFARQEQAIRSAKGKSDRNRWDRELTADLYLQATQTTRVQGKLAARQLGGVYDEQQTLAYLAENARIAAESINAKTFDDLDAEDADPEEVFATAKGSRASRIGLGRATLLVAFARTEAGKQSQAADGRERTKTWVVTSGPHSRHPEMNGETVSVSENFSNGLAWPGDGRGGAAEVADCQCLLQLS
jgi:HK97 family phage portal protein